MSKKILIVDDSLLIRKILRDLLEKEYEVVEADSCDQAIEMFAKEKPDLTFLDIIMCGGEEEGIRALKEIIKIDSKARVLMISAVGRASIIKECKNIGAVDYIIKPFDEDEILKLLEKYLQ